VVGSLPAAGRGKTPRFPVPGPLPETCPAISETVAAQSVTTGGALAFSVRAHRASRFDKPQIE